MSNPNTRSPADQQPRLYTDLAWVWPFVSPPEDYPEEVATFHARFERRGVPDGAPVLHLGCGGGIDWHLKRHYRLTGVDLNPGMLAYARNLNPEVDYLLADIRDVRLGRKFVAVLLHDAAAYMTTPADLRAAYATAASHLAPGGALVTPPEELRSRFRQHRVQAETHQRGEHAVTMVTVDFDPDRPTPSSSRRTYSSSARQGSRCTWRRTPTAAASMSLTICWSCSRGLVSSHRPSNGNWPTYPPATSTR